MHNPQHAPESRPSTSSEPPAASASAPLPGASFQLKRCRTCGHERSLDAFFMQGKCVHRHRPDCRACMVAYTRRRREKVRAGGLPESERRCRHCAQLRPATEFPSD